MSIPPINPFAGMAAHQPSDEQRQLHAERERSQDQAKMLSASETDAEAAAAAASSDREADGRQDWQPKHPKDGPTAGEDGSENDDVEEPHRSKSVDPNCGSRLDLEG